VLPSNLASTDPADIEIPINSIAANFFNITSLRSPILMLQEQARRLTPTY
jgi:hypothetical protein